MRINRKRIFPLLALVLLAFPNASCVTSAGNYSPPESDASAVTRAADRAANVEKRILGEFERWQGTPHRLGGSDFGGVDCSGLVQSIYRRAFGIDLPRTTRQQVRSGQPLTGDALKAGDLVFFQPPDYPLHVGIYLSRNRFVHASKSRGVVLSRIGPEYWAQYFRTARRILPE